MTRVAEEMGVMLTQEEGEAALTGSNPLLSWAEYHLVEHAAKYGRPNSSVTMDLADGRGYGRSLGEGYR